MKCAERDRMRELYRLAAHELGSLLQEESRLLVEEEFSEEFGEVVDKGVDHRRAARNTYLQHVAEHGCLKTRGAARPSSE